MMDISRVALAGVLLATLIAAQSASAQSPCADINFDSSITSRFPDASDACLGIQLRDGRQFAHFQAELVGVTGNHVRARFRLPDGDYSDTYGFDVSPEARVQIDGRDYRYRDLNRGQQLDVYVPPDRWQFHIPESEQFAASRTVAVFTPVQEEDSGAGAMLPSTASPLPFIGIVGSVLSLVGLALLAVRRRLPR